MINKLSKILKTLLTDFKRTPKTMKMLLPVILFFSVLVTSCMSLSPSANYVDRQVENAEEIFPVVSRLIDSASQEQIATAANIQTQNEEIINHYKDALKKRLETWLYLMKKEKQLLQKGE
ncbi:hypothetical protein [Candidatus Uabimicrobium amorphum]|uniref:Uncharacterized protein n=1 Tax=Uabimicrobium amorphum TaxID=2596890 RepID=A0A5S9F4C0_UABAM|nr:hypothetical protein [Candidatus Uabimicrobium amorphum]BBM84429.1 hypothetical protein UABAM_02789 [Candidatus Uabimicrobium amorphum]